MKMSRIRIILLIICCLVLSAVGFVQLNSRSSLFKSNPFRPTSLSASRNDDVNNSEFIDVGTVYGGKLSNLKEKKTDDRNSLPFVVQALQDTDTGLQELGTYLLDPSTSCGDYLDLGSRGVFKVKKVKFLYKYDQGKFRVFKKKLEVIFAKAPWTFLNIPEEDTINEILQ